MWVVITFESCDRSAAWQPAAQVDEIWHFVYATSKNVLAEKRGTFGVGDVWTWVAIDTDSKLILSWRIDARDAATAHELMQDLPSRVRGHIQRTALGST